MDSHQKLLLANQAWVQARLNDDPGYFVRTSAEQHPAFLWIGCLDSRVPAEEITGTEPGELFVHRNIANLVVHTDFNLLSVLAHAVETLAVKHIIVCGHYGCGGVKNAMTRHDFGLLNKWLRNIKDVYRLHQQELESLADTEARYRRLVELNVQEQVRNLAETSIVQRAWHQHQRPIIHGWVYDMATGQLNDLLGYRPGLHLEDVYMFEAYDGPLPEE